MLSEAWIAWVGHALMNESNMRNGCVSRVSTF